MIFGSLILIACRIVEKINYSSNQILDCRFDKEYPLDNGAMWGVGYVNRGNSQYIRARITVNYSLDCEKLNFRMQFLFRSYA